MNSIIVIGGGAAGLMAAYELSKHKLQVTVLEAKNRLGGRIFTLENNSFSVPVELGAEFIHGNLQYTLKLLDEANIKYYAIKGKMFHVEKGKFKKQKGFAEEWNTLMSQMKTLQEDLTLQDFLKKFFGDDKYAGLRESVKGFAGGFDLADISTASTKAIYREWNEEMDVQYRIDGGYQRMIDYLEAQCKANGCIIHKNCCVKKISWKKNEVNLLTMCSRIFKSDKLIITVPVSVLQANADNENYIEFAPLVPEHVNAAKNIGFGAVIKIILEFSEKFWSEQKNDVGFILIDEKIPTWWTQLPDNNAVLTGWLGAEKAKTFKEKTNEEILETALQSLANAFAVPVNELRTKLKASIVANWFKEPDINGGYSFNTIETTAARKIMQQPVNDTIFFAGEALFEGVPVGTVEAALSSGKQTALQVLNNLYAA